MSPAIRAAGATDVGRQRDVNEDRYFVDAARGIFVVVDGVGGQAAGGKAADTAIAALRDRLGAGSGRTADRVRRAIAFANNEIHRLAASRPEWRGMACVLTAAVIDGDRLVVGHVGDTRLYVVRGATLEKVTPDHSPVGEREDAREISEIEAMRHPRRHEVYRDVGSEVHQPADADFIWLAEIPLSGISGVLLCSDGLTDLVPSETIRQLIEAGAGQPAFVADALIEAANDAGGKDNITVIYVEALGTAPARPRAASVTSAWALAAWVILAAVGSVLIWEFGWKGREGITQVLGAPLAGLGPAVVRPGESIMTAVAQAQPGTTVIVEPGEYRERLTLKDGVRIMSRVPKGATLRLPGTAAEGEAAVVAAGVVGAELSGFSIVGDAATPLGIGVLVRDADVAVTDVHVAGASQAALEVGAGGRLTVSASEIVGNPGSAIVARSKAMLTVSHSYFNGNATAGRTSAAIVVEPGAAATWTRNVFDGLAPAALAGLDAASRPSPARNWFVGAPSPGRRSR